MPLTLRQGILDTERPDPSLLEPAEAGSNSFPCSYGCGSSKSQALGRQKSPLISSCLLHNCDMGQKSPGLPAVSGDFLKKLLLFLLGLSSRQLSPRRPQNQDASTAECQRHTPHCALANLSLLQPSSPNAGDTATLFPFSFFLCSILSIRL